MATSRRTGTNEGVATYGSSRDFSVLATWEALIDVDLTTGIEEVSVSNVTGDRFITGELLDFSSSSATATFYGINTAGTKIWYLVLTGTPTTADTITSNGASSASADIDTIDNTNTGMTAVLECYDDAASFDDNIGIGSSTTSASFRRIIRAAAGNGHDGTSNIGVYFKSTTAVALFAIESSELNCSIQDIIATVSINAGATVRTFQTGSSTKEALFVGCIAFDSLNSGGGTVTDFQTTGGPNYFVNCLSENADGNGYEIKPGSSLTSYVYNCTAIDSDKRGFNHSGSGTAVAKNCLADGHTTEDFDDGGTWTGSSHVASGDATADDIDATNGRIDQTFTFVNAGGNDYHLSGSDEGALGFGTDLSADGIFAFDDDIDGETITTWSIGFDSIVAAGGRIMSSLAGAGGLAGQGGIAGHGGGLAG